MSTPNLGISHLAAAQNQPEVTVNGALDAFDDSINLEVAISITDANTALTRAQLASAGVIQIEGALTADRDLNLPAVRRLFVLRNYTTGGHNLIVQVPGVGGSTVALSPAGGLTLLYSDGTNVTQLTGGGGGSSGVNFAEEETPSGTIDGSNAAFTLAHTPSPAGSLKLYKNGVRMKAGGVDYTLATATVTYVSGVKPLTGDSHVCDYRY